MTVTDYEALVTEQRNPRSRDLDKMDTIQLLQVINDEDKTVPYAVADAIPQIAQAVDVIVDRLKKGGRVLYVGAGTSGRLGIIDAAECPPTFGVDPELVSAIIAGGRDAVFQAVEECEDDEALGEADVTARVMPNHVVVGISASGVTPYVRGALRAARSLDAATIAIVCTEVEGLDFEVDVMIPVITGPEVLTGSTRMKAGTAQKLVLNMISTASMVKLGKVYDNLMVDLNATNKKLRNRAIRIISMATGLNLHESTRLFEESGANVKVALVMGLAGATQESAHLALEQTEGYVRQAIDVAKTRSA
ncbi:MAG TPA: N-acetylmuramic acid 6-phosphate etherase [Bacillota bacterium]|nr:N-acetylmuramic acid 6-phosphate etherase [Bacillota bacterium]